MRVRGIARRRWVWLIVIPIVAGLVTVPVAVVLGWLLPPTGGLRAVVAYAVALWLALVLVGVAVVVLVDQRPPRRVVLLALAGVVTVPCCGVPGTTFWTFAVSHGPEGADCPACRATLRINIGKRLRRN